MIGRTRLATTTSRLRSSTTAAGRPRDDSNSGLMIQTIGKNTSKHHRWLWPGRGCLVAIKLDVKWVTNAMRSDARCVIMSEMRYHGENGGLPCLFYSCPSVCLLYLWPLCAICVSVMVDDGPAWHYPKRPVSEFAGGATASYKRRVRVVCRVFFFFLSFSCGVVRGAVRWGVSSQPSTEFLGL